MPKHVTEISRVANCKFHTNCTILMQVSFKIENNLHYTYHINTYTS